MRIRVALTKHTCTACGKSIEKGARYWREEPSYNDLGNYAFTPRKEHISCPVANYTASAEGIEEE